MADLRQHNFFELRNVRRRPRGRLERLEKAGGAHVTVRYAEFNSTGAGASPAKRPDWTKQLTNTGVREFTLQNVLGGADHWIPGSPLADPAGKTSEK
jgi:hypothetical protein